jgi:hypothetical protein
MLAIGIGLMLAQPRTASTCSCAMAPTPASGWTRADLVSSYSAVFRGVVSEVAPQEVHSGTTSGHYVATFRVSEVWKGPALLTMQVGAG